MLVLLIFLPVFVLVPVPVLILAPILVFVAITVFVLGVLLFTVVQSIRNPVGQRVTWKNGDFPSRIFLGTRAYLWTANV